MAAQGDFSEYAVDRELDLWLGGQAVTPPATVYVGLSTYQSFHLSGDYLEPVGGGYARVAVPNDLAHWPAAEIGRAHV